MIHELFVIVGAIIFSTLFHPSDLILHNSFKPIWSLVFACFGLMIRKQEKIILNWNAVLFGCGVFLTSQMNFIPTASALIPLGFSFVLVPLRSKLWVYIGIIGYLCVTLIDYSFGNFSLYSFGPLMILHSASKLNFTSADICVSSLILFLLNALFTVFHVIFASWPLSSFIFVIFPHPAFFFETVRNVSFVLMLVSSIHVSISKAAIGIGFAGVPLIKYAVANRADSPLSIIYGLILLALCLLFPVPDFASKFQSSMRAWKLILACSAATVLYCGGFTLVDRHNVLTPFNPSIESSKCSSISYLDDTAHVFISLTTTPKRMLTADFASSMSNLQNQNFDRSRFTILLNLPITMKRTGELYPEPPSDWAWKFPNLKFNRDATDSGPSTKLLPSLLMKDIKLNDFLLVLDDDEPYHPNLICDYIHMEHHLPDVLLARRGQVFQDKCTPRSDEIVVDSQPGKYSNYSVRRIDIVMGVGSFFGKRSIYPDKCLLSDPASLCPSGSNSDSCKLSVKALFTNDDIWISGCFNVNKIPMINFSYRTIFHNPSLEAGSFYFHDKSVENSNVQDHGVHASPAVEATSGNAEISKNTDALSKSVNNGNPIEISIAALYYWWGGCQRLNDYEFHQHRSINMDTSANDGTNSKEQMAIARENDLRKIYGSIVFGKSKPLFDLDLHVNKEDPAKDHHHSYVADPISIEESKLFGGDFLLYPPRN